MALLAMAACNVLTALYAFKEKRAHKARDSQFVFQNAQNEIFEIFKMFKNNIKFTRAACRINSKINNRDDNITLVVFICFHYCWSLLWCNY